MRIDIYSGRGIIFTADEFLKVINGKNKADVVAACLTFHQDLLKYSACRKNRLVESFKALGNLKKTMNLDEIRVIIASVVEVGGEVSKYGDCWVEHAEYVQDLFEKILDVSGHDCLVNLPYIQEVTAWGSDRRHKEGRTVPKGVACVVFDSDSCFERKLSDQGKAVKKLFGHCDETEWTEMSG